MLPPACGCRALAGALVRGRVRRAARQNAYRVIAAETEPPARWPTADRPAAAPGAACAAARRLATRPPVLSTERYLQITGRLTCSSGTTEEIAASGWQSMLLACPACRRSSRGTAYVLSRAPGRVCGPSTGRAAVRGTLGIRLEDPMRLRIVMNVDKLELYGRPQPMPAADRTGGRHAGNAIPGSHPPQSERTLACKRKRRRSRWGLARRYICLLNILMRTDAAGLDELPTPVGPIRASSAGTSG